MTKACFGRRPPAAVRAVVGGALGALRPAAAAPQAAGLPQQTDPAEDQAAGGGRCPVPGDRTAFIHPHAGMATFTYIDVFIHYNNFFFFNCRC